MSTFPSFPVYIAQYTRDKDHQLPFHWELIIHLRHDVSRRIPKPVGIGFHIIDPTTEFGFQRQDNFYYECPASWAGSLHIGSVRIDRVELLWELLTQVQMWQSESHCQKWMQLGLRKLYMHGFNIDREIAESLPNLQQKMSDLYKRWNGEGI
ncbi:hypothetical protein B0H21DRAFT_708750 [Amylocystis lapponica]|nr:hypothetical protein B0H21DRAFT_708750 [Amylocystis lapponica]